MARFSPVVKAAPPLLLLLLLAAAAATAIQSGGERRAAVVPPHYFDRATPPLTVRHRPGPGRAATPSSHTAPPYAVPMEPLVPYSQPDPLYHRPQPTAGELQALRKSGDAEAAAAGAPAALADEPAPGPGPAPDALFPDSDAQAGQHLLDFQGAQHGPRVWHVHGHAGHKGYAAKHPQPVYVREPEPIIEIIIKESNESLPAPPPPPPPPPPKKEPVHVFYVKYKKDPSKYGKESVVYDAPIPAVTPPTTEEPTPAPSYGPPVEHVTSLPPSRTTTLRTIIRPESETVHGSGLRVTFGGPHDEEWEQPSESAQRPSLALPQPQPQAGSAQASHGPHKREQAFFPPPPPPPPPPPSAPGAFPPPAFQQSPSSFGPHRPHVSPAAPFLRHLPGQAQPFAPPPQRPPPQSFLGPPQPPKLRPQPQFGLQQPFQRPVQPPSFRPGPSASFPTAPPPPPHARTPPNQQYIEQQRKVIQQQQAELFQHQQQQHQQQQQQIPQQQANILQNLQQQRHQQQLQHQQHLQQQHLQQQRLQQQQQRVPHPSLQSQSQPSLPQLSPQPQPQSQPQHHHTAQSLGFNGEIVKSVPSLEEHLTTREGPRPAAQSHHFAGQEHGPGQGGNSFAQSGPSEPPKPATFTQQHSQPQHFPQYFSQTPLSRPFSAPQAPRHPSVPAVPPTTKPPKVFSLLPSSSAPSTTSTTTTAAPTTAAAAAGAKSKDKPLPALPDEVPEDLRQQLLSSGILSNADIQVLDYDKVGDIPIESLPPEALENFYGAGSAPVPAVLAPNGSDPAAASRARPKKAPVQMKVVRYDSGSPAGQQLAQKYVREDATQLDPVVLNDAGYNRYLPLKVSGVGFPLPDAPELRGRNVTSVVILAPVDYDLLQRDGPEAAGSEAGDSSAAGDDDADRAARAAAVQVKGVRFVTGDILKELVKSPTGENYRRWLERERQATTEKQAIILLVAEGGSDATGKEIFMYDAGSLRVSKLSGKLSAAFVDVAEANASSQDIDKISSKTPHIMELRHRGALDDASAEASANVPSISASYSKTSAS